MLEYCKPEDVGIDSAAIARFEAEIRKRGVAHQGYMIYKDGKVAAASIASPYRMGDKRHVYSVSKSFTATAIGIAVDEGLLSVDDTVISFFPELLPETVSENLARMRVKHLLTMTTGHRADTFSAVADLEGDWAKAFLSIDVQYEPGTFFCYNTPATYMLSAIITKLTGMRMYDYLRPRLFEPLGIENVVWNVSPDGVDFGGWGIHVSMEDILKLGILYLGKGMYDGKRIVSEKWVDEATAAFTASDAWVDVDWTSGYGYQIWRNRNGHGYRFDGAYGQFGLIFPEKSCIVVLISEAAAVVAGGAVGVLNAFWDTLYDEIGDEPIRGASDSVDISAYPFMIPPEGTADVTPCAVLLEDNPYEVRSIEIAPANGGLVFTVTGKEHTASMLCAYGKWEYNSVSKLPMLPYPNLLERGDVGAPAEIAAAYALQNGRICISLMFLTTPHGVKITLAGETVVFEPTIGTEQISVKTVRK